MTAERNKAVGGKIASYVIAIDPVTGAEGSGETVELGPTSLAALESVTTTGPLTDTQLRATPVPVSGPLTDAQLTTQLAALAVLLEHTFVTVEAALPAGANAIGKLAANSGVDIGDVDVTSISAGENHLGEVGGNTAVVAVTFTRPGDTSPYAANDVVCNSTSAPAVLTLTNAMRVTGGSGYITKVRLTKSTNATTNASFRVYFFGTAPVAINDNAPWTLLYADAGKYLGFVDLTLATEGTGSDAAAGLDLTARIAAFAAGGSRDLYAVVVAKAAYTPGNAEQWHLAVSFERN